MIYLMGVGPGDVKLLTLKAYEVLQKADVVIYDRLANNEILKFCPKAKKIYVGKESNNHIFKQCEINQLIVDESQMAENVVRLKGGDPFVFGRGGEEANFLIENNLAFEVISGITSAIAVPTYAGIPITYRGISSSFAVVTGHEDPDKLSSSINWKNLATAVDTLIFLMGAANISKISKKLLENGRSPQTSVAVIRWGTKSNQEVFIMTLQEASVQTFLPPAVIVIGEVVNLRERLRWFDSRILFGKKIVVTRSKAQASKFSNALRNLGAEVLELPMIKIVPPSDDFLQIDSAIKMLNQFDWIIFTSTNGVESFFERLKNSKLDARALGHSKIAVIGSATAEKLSEYGIKADVIPKNFVAEALIDELIERVVGKKVLVARAEKARNVLIKELKKAGAKVIVAPVYKTVLEKNNDFVNFNSIDMVTFTSSSIVKNFIDTYGSDCLKKTLIASIGSITAQTLESFGLSVNIISKESTIDGFVNAIKSFYEGDLID